MPTERSHGSGVYAHARYRAVAMTVVIDPTKPYTSAGLGPWSPAAKEGDLGKGSRCRRRRLTVCLGLRTTSDGDVGGGGQSADLVLPSPSSPSPAMATGSSEMGWVVHGPKKKKKGAH
jgi:hypothetical protein